MVRLIVRNDLFIYSSSRYFKERQTRTERILIGDVFASEWNVFPCSYDVYLIFSLASTLVFTRAWRIKKGGEGKNCQILRFRSTEISRRKGNILQIFLVSSPFNSTKPAQPIKFQCSSISRREDCFEHLLDPNPLYISYPF